MTFRSLLVYLDSTPACTPRVRLAARLAQEWDCHLVGLAPTGLIDRPPADEGATPLAEYAGLAWDRLRDQAERATEHFREECRVNGLKSFEAVMDEADKASSLTSHAHCSDLVVMSRSSPDAADFPRAQDLVEQVVLSSARPTLILPAKDLPPLVGARALVAWDDSPESARALSDALPILRRSSQVTLATWERDPGQRDPALPARLEAVQRWLMWHGVASESLVEATALPVAQAINSRATLMKADLIVMGAYGHPRWAERMLGGVTEAMLASANVPVLMSH